MSLFSNFGTALAGLVSPIAPAPNGAAGAPTDWASRMYLLGGGLRDIGDPSLNGAGLRTAQDDLYARQQRAQQLALGQTGMNLIQQAIGRTGDPAATASPPAQGSLVPSRPVGPPRGYTLSPGSILPVGDFPGYTAPPAASPPDGGYSPLPPPPHGLGKVGNVLDALFLGGAINNSQQRDYARQVNGRLTAQALQQSQLGTQLIQQGMQDSSQGQASQTGSMMPQAGGPMAPQTGSASPLLNRRMQLGLAALAMSRGDYGSAASIMSGDVRQGTDGTLFDGKTGQVVGRIPSHQVVNGFNLDLGAPDAPNYVPTLPAGTMPDGRGGVVNLPGAVDAQAAQAGATANAQEAAKAGYDLVPVPVGNGRTQLMPRSIAAAMLAPQAGRAAGVPGVSATPNGAGGLGVAPSKADEAFDTDQATGASKTIGSDLDARPAALQDLDNARTALAYINAHRADMNPTATFNVAAANYFRSLPPAMQKSIGFDPNNPKSADRLANDAAVYQRLSSSNLLSFSKSNLPSRYTEREMMVAGRVIPQLTTAPDAASFHWGLQAAIANKAVQRSQFAADYTGPKSRQAMEQAWNATPQGSQSLFQDPVWQNVQIGGKPAVVYKTINGKTYGAVGIGTGHPTFFEVR